jgi:hypothetical protein
VAGYVGVSLAAMVAGRSGPYTAQVLGQTLRYVADSVVVVAVAMALFLCAPNRARRNVTALASVSAKAPLWRARARSGSGLVVAVAFLVGSVFSTVTFTRTWSYSPTAVYLSTVRTSLAANHVAPLLDQPISNRILWRLAKPNNLGSRVFSPVPERADFVSSTPVLQRLDDSGHIVPAEMKTLRTAAIGPIPRCGYQVSDLGYTNMPLDGGLIHFGWTVHFGYLTSEPGSLEVALETGPSVIVPVTAGLNQVFVNVEGNGTLVRVRSHTRGMVACVAGAVVGLLDNPAAQP